MVLKLAKEPLSVLEASFHKERKSPNTLAFGRPAKVVRELTEEDRKDMERIRTQYVEKGQYYKSLQNDFTAAIILAAFYIKSNFFFTKHYYSLNKILLK